MLVDEWSGILFFIYLLRFLFHMIKLIPASIKIIGVRYWRKQGLFTLIIFTPDMFLDSLQKMANLVNVLWLVDIKILPCKSNY